MTRLYRLAAARHARTLWSGQGGLLSVARWHARPCLVVYASESLALAQLEKLVQYRDRSQIPSQVLGRLDVPANIVPEAVDVTSLPRHWRRPNSLLPETQAIGDAWLARGGALVLQVPSAVSPGEFNCLVNPAHPDLTRCTQHPPEAFEFDTRLTRRP